MIYFLFSLTVILIYIESFDCKNTQIVIKKLLPIEINENVPIGYTITDLKANLIDHHRNNEDIYFNFEFFDNNNNKDNNNNNEESSPVNSINLRTYFLLDSHTGVLKTARSLDLESFCDFKICHKKQNGRCSIQFKIKAIKYFQSNQSKILKDSIFQISFDLVLVDVNEFAPEFLEQEKNQNLISLNVTEEFSPIKLPIGSVAYDNDCTDRNNLTYSVKVIKVNNQPADTSLYDEKLNFTILTDPDQMLLFLYSPESIDRESIQSIELNVIATDRFKYNDAKTGFLKILLNILDINDNSPMFQNQIINLEIDEGLPIGTEIIHLKATDLDSGLNGQIEYELVTGLNDEIQEAFVLNSSTGILSLRKSLHFEVKTFWHLSIKASDKSLGSSKSNVALINLRINDINDHKPEINVNFFILNGYIGIKYLTNKNVNKNLITKQDIIYLFNNLPIDSAIGMVSVTDKDSFTNGEIENCEINFINMKINKEPIIRLELFDENVNSTFIFSSDTNLNREMVTMYKSDLYESNGDNEKKYIIRTNAKLVKQDSYEVELKATDNGINHKLIDKRSIKILVTDSQLNEISKSNNDLESDQLFNIINLNNNQEYNDLEEIKTIYNIIIQENNNFPTLLAKFTPSDFEMSSNVFYSIVLIPSSRSFSEFHFKILKCSSELYKNLFIGQLTGDLILNASLDRETCTDYLFLIKTIHSIEERLTSFIYLRIHVVDQNDNLPWFEYDHYSFNLIENHPINKSIGNPIRLFDSDSFNLNYHSFKIISNDNTDSIDEMFSILMNKESNEIMLVLKTKLDYELQNKYKFKIVVNDNINNGSKTFKDSKQIAQIEINILDANENKPYIKSLQVMEKSLVDLKKVSNIDQDYMITVNIDSLPMEQSTSYFNLIQIEAVDLDSNEMFSKINYSIINIKYYEFQNEKAFKEFNSNPKKCNFTDFFKWEMNEFMHLRANLYRINSKKHDYTCPIPLAMLLTIKISDFGEPVLYSLLEIKLIIINNQLKANQLQNIQNYLVNKYSSKPNFYSTNKNFDSDSGKLTSNEKNKSLKEKFSTIHPPLIIISILILILLLTMISLFVMSIIYSVRVCNFLNCTKIDDDLLKRNTLITNNNNNQENKDLKYRNKFTTWLSNPSALPLNDGLITNRLFESSNNPKSDCLLDSPILIKKFNDTDIKRYNLEYLMDKSSDKLSLNNEIINNNNYNNVQTTIEKPLKRISFKSPQSIRKNISPDDSLTSNDETKKVSFDDDLIIPFKSKRVDQKKKKKTENKASYKKAHLQPEDNIWIRNNQMPNKSLEHSEVII